MMLFFLLFVYATARTFDYSACPIHRQNETAEKLTQRRLSISEWNKCGPTTISECATNETNISDRKRITAPMRPSTPAEWAACPHKREDALRWVIKFCDSDQDGLICWEEVAKAKNELLSTAEKVFLLFAAPELIMKHCAGDDGYISKKDFDTRTDTCLRNCESLLNFYEYFVDKAVAKNYRPKPIKCSAKKTPELVEEGRRAMIEFKNIYENQ